MRAVGVIIENEKGEILLMKRTSLEESDHNKWDNVGGKVKEYETFEEAVVREVKGEIGCNADSLELLLENEYSKDDTGEIYHVQIFGIQIKGEPKLLEPHLSSEMRWFDKSELDKADLTSYVRDDFIRLGWIQK